MPDVKNEAFADLIFPLGGISLSDEYQLQQEGTTPDAVNVRAYETFTDRARGGSRPGLSRYINERVNG